MKEVVVNRKLIPQDRGNLKKGKTTGLKWKEKENKLEKKWIDISRFFHEDDDEAYQSPRDCHSTATAKY